MNKKNVYLLARNRSVYLEQLLMNRIRLLMMLLMSMAGALAIHGQTVRSGQTACGTLVFDSLRIDMGRVEKDSAAVAVFHFRVDGDAHLCAYSEQQQHAIAPWPPFPKPHSDQARKDR